MTAMVAVKPTGKLPVPLPHSMRSPALPAIPLAGATVPLTLFIQRRLDQGDLVLAEPPAAKPAAPAKGA